MMSNLHNDNNKHVSVCQYPSETNPQKPKKKRSRKPVRFYAWQGNADQLIEGQYSSSGEFVFMPGGAYSEGRFINAKSESDFTTVSTFKSAWHNETLESGKKVRQIGRRKENLHTLHACYLDIDSSLPITEDVILQRCRAYNLPEPTHIVCTSKNHYQLQWELQKPAICNSSNMLNLWEVDQKGLHALFEDLGSDEKVSSDPVRYLRNPHKQGAINFKYPDKPEVVTVHSGNKTSLSELYSSLKEHGFIKQVIEFPKLKKSRRLGKGVSLSRITQFISTNPSWTGSYKQLATITGVCERSLHRLREKQLIKVERFRVGSIYKIRLNFSDCHPLKEVSIKHSSFFSSSNLYQLIIKNFNKNGICEGFRNESLFMLSRYLSYSGKSMFEILKLLQPGLEKCQNSGHSFTQKEIEKTVNSACRKEYKYYYNTKSEPFQKLLAELGNEVLQLEKIPIQHLKADNKTSISRLVDVGLIPSKNGNLKVSEMRYSRNMQGILESIRVKNKQRNESNYNNGLYEHKFEH